MSSASEQLFSKSSTTTFADLRTDRKCVLINTLWPHLHMTEQDYIEEDYTAFFDFIGRILQSLHPHASKFVIQDLDGLLSIVSKLRASLAVTRKELTADLKRDYLNTSDASITRSMELVGRFWLGINLRSNSISVGAWSPRDTCIDWQDEQTLDEEIVNSFEQKAAQVLYDDSPLDESFTAANLKFICRLKLRWTDNLIDHLRLEGPRGKRSLSIYRHKISLINHQKDVNPAIPKDVLDEAIRTLDLLFPFGDPRSEQLLEEEGVQLHIISPKHAKAATDVNDFRYWRKNIAQLLKLLNGPPETVAQQLLDTRNLSQFATLWVAIFGVFFLTILFGILATVYSVKQYYVAVKAYELSLSLACRQEPDLPRFCV
jgi:hypothetical protein